MNTTVRVCAAIARAGRTPLNGFIDRFVAELGDPQN
jgi:hypothetical protein